MRIFALSDIHVDFDFNARWVASLSAQDYRDDFLILAGDISDSLRLLETSLITFANRFKKVFYVPGNHDLWVNRDNEKKTSFDKFTEIRKVMKNCGVSGAASHGETISIVPLLGWYDYSFGDSQRRTQDRVDGFQDVQMAATFSNARDRLLFHGNEPSADPPSRQYRHFLLTFPSPHRRHAALHTCASSNCLSRIGFRCVGAASPAASFEYSRLRTQPCKSPIEIDGITYINNAFGYPSETRIAAKRLLCIHG